MICYLTLSTACYLESIRGAITRPFTFPLLQAELSCEQNITHTRAIMVNHSSVCTVYTAINYQLHLYARVRRSVSYAVYSIWVLHTRDQNIDQTQPIGATTTLTPSGGQSAKRVAIGRCIGHFHCDAFVDLYSLQEDDLARSSRLTGRMPLVDKIDWVE